MAETKVTNAEINLAGSGNTAVVSTNQSTSTGSYVDLTTPGPAVTVNVGVSGSVLIGVAMMQYVTGSGFAFACVAVSGATTVAASDADSLNNSSTAAIRGGFCYVLTGLTPGSNTFTLKYKNSATTANFQDRRLSVVPL